MMKGSHDVVAVQSVVTKTKLTTMNSNLCQNVTYTVAAGTDCCMTNSFSTTIDVTALSDNKDMFHMSRLRQQMQHKLEKNKYMCLAHPVQSVLTLVQLQGFICLSQQLLLIQM